MKSIFIIFQELSLKQIKEVESLALILFQVFFFIILHVDKIAEENSPLFLKWDNLILESKTFDFKIKF